MTLDPSQQSNPRRISGGIKQILLGQQGPIQSSNQAMERVAALITIDHYFTILRIANSMGMSLATEGMGTLSHPSPHWESMVSLHHHENQRRGGRCHVMDVSESHEP